MPRQQLFWQAAFAVFLLVCSHGALATDDSDDESEAAPAVAFNIGEFSSEAAALEGLNAALDAGLRLDKGNGRVVIEGSMAHGWWKVAEAVVSAGRKQGVDLTVAVHQSADAIRRKLQSLTESLQNAGASEGIPPAFQWAQSPDSVFLNVKFAHKWDTPATLGCVEETVTISNSSVLFGVTCKEKKKKFKLEFESSGTLLPETSTWSMSSVGRAMFTLAKATPGTWPKLMRSGKKPANMHVWWEMHEKYEDENRAKDDEIKAALRKKKDDDAKAAAAAAEGTVAPEITTTTAGAEEAGTATVSATPVPTPRVDKRKSALEREYSKKRKALDAKLKETLVAIDTETRTKKKAVEDSANAQKDALEADAAKSKSSSEAEFSAQKAALDAELAQKISELPPLPADDSAAATTGGEAESSEL